MQKKLNVAGAVALALGLAVGTSSVQADDFWDMMNPAWWMGLDDDDDDDWKYWVYGPGSYYRYGYGGPHGYGGPYGYGYRGYGHPGYVQQKSKKKAAPPPPPVPE